MLKKLLTAAVCLFSLNAFADDHKHDEHEHEHREGQVHEHGHLQSQITLEHNHLAIHIFGAADSFLGFEHAPENAGEEAVIADLKAHVDAAEVVKVNAEAQCIFKEGHFELILPKEGEEGHANGEIELNYECAMPENLQEITYNWSVFHELEDLDAELIAGDKLAKEELSSDHNSIHLD